MSLFFTHEVPVVGFGQDPNLFVRVRDALGWHDNNPGLGNKKNLPILRRALEQFENGTLEIDD